MRILQRRLAGLHYAVPQSGVFDDGTGRAVIAYRKVNGLARVAFADGRVLRRVLGGSGSFHVRYPKHGQHVEADLSRQVLALIRGSKVERIYPISSGSPVTPTVLGSFRFYSKTPGTNAKGMVDSNYFIRGYAIHGYAVGPGLQRQPRLPAGADPQRARDLRLGRDRGSHRRLAVGPRRFLDEPGEQRRHAARGVPRPLAVRAAALAEDALDLLERIGGAERLGVRARERQRLAADLRQRPQRAVVHQSVASIPSRAARKLDSSSASRGSSSVRVAAPASWRARPWISAARPPTVASEDWASIARTSTVPSRGCRRTSHHRYV